LPTIGHFLKIIKLERCKGREKGKKGKKERKNTLRYNLRKINEDGTKVMDF
jgi:hypothetical protein